MNLLELGLNVLECTCKTIRQCILSVDKFDKIRGNDDRKESVQIITGHCIVTQPCFAGYEILGNLCLFGNKEDFVTLMGDEIYSTSFELLTLDDVELMLAALDALYSLSKLGEETCTRIMLTPGSVG